ncbi:RNA methyltransferase [Woodsholea maritima]|uniref:RNA methyltransferase n=1 Tax=Woodsholea maritima TaxID=240237 RepID=UPI00037548C2|nr:RNA methyltransferase [Woodsholea maritima]
MTPAFVLVGPQLGENIGAAARVMGNFGLSDLRIVAPRDGWPNPKAVSMAAGSPVLEKAQLYDDLESAIGECTYLFATTARPRGMVKPVFNARDAIGQMKTLIKENQKVGILFGAEKSGLPNEAVTMANAIITLPVDRSFSSLNLSMACGVLAHEWAAGAPIDTDFITAEPMASREDLERLYVHFEEELEKGGFFYPPEKKPLMVQNLRNIFARGGLTEQEVRTLRGAIKALAKGRGKYGLRKGEAGEAKPIE